MRDTWRDNAICKQEHIDIFFPKNGDYTVAKTICGDCPVRKECLDYDVMMQGDFPEFYGMYGGKTAPERYTIWEQRYLYGNK